MSANAQELQELLASLLEESILLENSSVVVYSQKSIYDQVKTIVESFAQSLNITYKLTQETQDDKNWVQEYKKSFKAQEIGNFRICAPWHEKSKTKTNIIVEPGLIFGTGDHATTRLCLLEIDKFVKKNQSFLDLGAGTGILSLAAASKGARVSFCDTDCNAIENAKQNFKNNELSFEQSWCGSLNKTNKSYDCIAINISSDILLFLKKDIIVRLSSGGVLILCGILEQNAQKINHAFSELKKIDEACDSGWTRITFMKEE